MDEKSVMTLITPLLLILLTIVFLALQIVFQIVTKRANKEVMDKMDTKFEAMLKRFDERTQEIASEIKANKEGYHAGISKVIEGLNETLILVRAMSLQQHEIGDNMLKVSITNKHTSRIQERLLEKLDTHAVECKERNTALQKLGMQA